MQEELYISKKMMSHFLWFQLTNTFTSNFSNVILNFYAVDSFFNRRVCGSHWFECSLHRVLSVIIFGFPLVTCLTYCLEGGGGWSW